MQIPERKRGIIRNNLKGMISLILAFVLLVNGMGKTLADGVSSGREFDPLNWQSELKDSLAYNDFVLPSSHDSGTYNIRFTEIGDLCQELVQTIYETVKEKVMSVVGGLVAAIVGKYLLLLSPIILLFANNIVTTIQQMCGKCQSKSIREQLKAGVRAFDFRYRYDGGQFHIYHGDETKGLAGLIQTCVCYDEHGEQLRLEECFSDIRDFLKEHPTEFVVITVQNEGGEDNESVRNALKELESRYGIRSLPDDSYVRVRDMRERSMTPQRTRRISPADRGTRL